MTRLESETLHLRKEWQSLEEVVGAALARLEPVLGDRPVRLSLPADLPLVRLDDVLFEQVVRNLVENACKYAPPGEAIEVGAIVEAGVLRLEVADRGPGIAAGEEQRLFEKFYRGTNAAGRPGVGLGLSICRAIVEAHGGTIDAAPRPGGGALFVVRLPLESPPADLIEPEPQPAELGS
jgi:two-component system sensor histidine kinase KdpD